MKNTMKAQTLPTMSDDRTNKCCGTVCAEETEIEKTAEKLCAEAEPRAQKSAPERERRLVLFVCTGNTCRSPMAEALFNAKYAGEDKSAASCGLFVTGRTISANAEKALEDAGVHGFSHMPQNVNSELMRRADLIVGITCSHASQLMMSYPQFASKIAAMPKDIPDPYGGTLEDYKRCLEKIDEGLAAAFAPKKGDLGGAANDKNTDEGCCGETESGKNDTDANGSDGGGEK